MMTTATFIGTDGSMGLQNGLTYRFELKTDSRYIWVCFGLFGKEIPYATMKALLKNWKF